MGKYIDAEKLIAEIERRREKCADIAADERNEEVAEYYRGMEVAYDETSTLIASLQQGQPLTVEKVVEQCKKFGGNPEVIQPEVDLEKEIKDTCRGYRINDYHEQELGKHDIENIARHFYELGLNAKKKD